jgi:hypothetical protein
MDQDDAGRHRKQRRPQDFTGVHEHAVRRSEKRRVAADQLTAGIQASNAERLPVARLEVSEPMDHISGTAERRQRSVAKPADIDGEFVHLICFGGSFRFSSSPWVGAHVNPGTNLTTEYGGVSRSMIAA